MEKFKVIAITGFTVMMNIACSPNGFNSLSSSSTSSSTMQQLPDISENQKSCTLSLQNSDFTDSAKVVFGEKIKLKLNANYEIPADAKIILLGDADLYSNSNFKSLDLTVSDLDKIEFDNSYRGLGSGYNSEAKKFNRQITVFQNEQILCSTNAVTFEFLYPKDMMGISCVALGGHLRTDETEHDTCYISAISLWKTFISLKGQTIGNVKSIEEVCKLPGGTVSKFDPNFCFINNKKLYDFNSQR